MSAQWMLYALLVGVALTFAALAGEQSARLRRRPARGMWALAMVLTVALPLLVPPSPTRQPVAPDRRAAAQLSAPAGVAAVAAIGAGNWLPAQSSPTGTIDIDQVVRLGWQVSSALALLVLAGASLALRRRARHWQRGTLAGREVLVSVDAGPAVLGVLRPHIVVPTWLLRAPAARQVLVIAHEQAHIDAGDQRLLAAMALLLVAMPWNVPLWFQLRRLRLAIEVDCDARVLDQGHHVADYGAALIDIGSHASSSLACALAPAMAESTGFLAQRVRLMTRRPARWHRFAAPVMLLMAIETGVAAARIPAPPQDAGTPVAVEVRQATRQALAGYYALDDNRVAVVSVTADGLELMANGGPLWRLLPESADRYFVPGSGLRVRFDRATGTLTPSQFGADAAPAARVDGAAVERADAYVAARAASGQPLPGGEAIVRRNAGAREAGELHAEDFTPGFLQQARALMPRQSEFNATHGAVEDVTFDGVSRSGWDLYKVRYAKGTVTWAIWQDGSGRLAAARPVDTRR